MFRRGLQPPLALLFAAFLAPAVVVPAHAELPNSKTVLTPAVIPAMNTKEAEEALALTHSQRVWVQQGLNDLRFDVGAADGVFGPRSRAAIARWQSARGEAATGYLDAQAAAMLVEVGKVASSATPQTVRPDEATGTLNEALSSGDGRPVTGKPAPPSKPQKTARQAVLKTLNEALVLAPKIRDSRGRVRLLAEIAPLQAKAGDTPGAARSISEAFSIAQKINKHISRVEALSRIALAQAEAGDTPGATRSISRALSAAAKESRKMPRTPKIAPRTVEIALTHIAKAQAELGDIQGALSTVRRIRGSTQKHQRVTALVDIAKLRVAAGDTAGATRVISEALSIARLIQPPSGRSRALQERHSRSAQWVRAILLSRIAPAQAATGDTLGAARSISEALSYPHRGGVLFDKLLERIASAQADIGDIPGALSTMRRIGDAWYRASALVDIAQAQLEAGDSAGATRSIWEAVSAAALGSRDVLDRYFLFRRIAQTQAAIGDIQGALSTAGSFGNRNTRFKILSAIAKGQATAGDISGALDTARTRIVDDVIRAYALIDIAQAQIKPGKAKRAKSPKGSIGRNQIGDEFGRTSTTGRKLAVGCSSPVIFEDEGTVVLPSVDIVALPIGAGTITLEYQAYSIPDRFVVEVDGQIKIDTQYVGSSRYTVGQVNNVLDHYGYRRTSQSSIISPGRGTRSFRKSADFRQAVVRIYAPLKGTEWRVTLRFHDSSCP